jgi:uncharacterized membrane protein
MSFWKRVLVGALLALAALFVFWFIGQPVSLAVFAGPPLLLALFNWTGHDKPAFWAGLCALAWFSHGVMVAWSRPMERELAWIEIVLSLVVVMAASAPGIRARFAGRR